MAFNLNKTNKMNTYERSAIIGYWRNGMTFELIGYLMGIHPGYAETIVKSYLKNKNL